MAEITEDCEVVQDKIKITVGLQIMIKFGICPPKTRRKEDGKSTRAKALRPRSPMGTSRSKVASSSSLSLKVKRTRKKQTRVKLTKVWRSRK